MDLNKSVETDNFFKYFPIVIYDGAILSGMSRAIAAEKSGTVLLNGVDIIEFDGTREEAERFPDAANFAHRELGPVVRVLTRKSCIAFNCEVEAPTTQPSSATNGAFGIVQSTVNSLASTTAKLFGLGTIETGSRP